MPKLSKNLIITGRKICLRKFYLFNSRQGSQIRGTWHCSSVVAAEGVQVGGGNGFTHKVHRSPFYSLKQSMRARQALY